MNRGRVKASHCCKNVKMAAAPLTQVSPLPPGHPVHVCSEGMWRPACLQGHFQFKNRLGVTFFFFFPSFRVLSRLFLSAALSQASGIHAQLSCSLYLTNSKVQPRPGFARTRHASPHAPARPASKYDAKDEILENFFAGDKLPSALLATSCLLVLMATCSL